MSSPFFTLFTPAYNCEQTIHRVFESVIKQTFRNFEWIIINDGSKDNTSQVIKNLIQSPGLSDIQITFLEFENFGKHSVWNKAVKLGKGVFFVPADSDDSFRSETFDFFYNKISLFSESELKKISGINVLCFDNETENIVGSRYPEDGFVSNNFELKYKLNLSGEKWGCIRLDLLKQFPFPEVNHSYYPEDYLWLTISKTHQVICYNKPLRNYFSNNDGITTTSVLGKKRGKSERQVTIQYYKWLLANFGFKIIINSPKKFIRLTARLMADMMYVGFKG